MSASIEPAAVRSVGGKAQHIGDTTVSFAAKSLTTAERDEGGAHLQGFTSKTGLNSVFTWWQPASSGLSTNVSSTGDKLISTANIYESTDNANVDQFRFIPWEKRPH